MLSENAASKLAILISYIEKLNEKLVEADDVHELKDEVKIFFEIMFIKFRFQI